MFTKTTLNKADNQNAENISQKKSVSNGKILPAVSPLQQKSIDSKAEPVQKVEEEEPLQGKFEAIQKMAPDEEPMQGKFDPVQKIGAEEEEPMQGKFNPVQKIGAEEEELPMQGKFEPVQKAEEEEPLQGKFEAIQKMASEEELPMQGKFDPVQKMEDEEPLQGKFLTIQKKNSQTAQLQVDKANATTKNNTGLPDNLKSGIENLSGLGMDDVKVHYNSEKPAQLNALAYAQGTDIHVASGQEKHLPHEAWHVVQQKEGRVKPTLQMKQGIPVNDDVGLENEADVMGAQATARGNMLSAVQKTEVKQLKTAIPFTIQRIDKPFGKSRRTLIDENDSDSQEMEDKGGEKELKNQFQKKPENDPPKSSLFSRIARSISGGASSAWNGLSNGASSAWNGLSKGASSVVTAIKKGGPLVIDKIKKSFTEGKSSEKASNYLLASTAIPSAASGSTSLVNKALGYKNGPSTGNGYTGGAIGSGATIGGMAAVGDFLGVGSHLAKAFSHGEDATDASHTTSKKIEAAAASLSSVSEGTKSAASAAHQIASLVNSQGVAAAGSAIAMAGASVATGAIDILRGGYGIWSAEQRKSILQAIATGADKQNQDIELIEIDKQKDKKAEQAKIKLMASAALAKQENVRDEGIGNVVKGSLAVAAGATVIALGAAVAATPVGWALLGAGAAVMGIMALVNYVKPKKAKAEIVARILKVEDKKKEYDKNVAIIKGTTWPFTEKRKKLMEDYEPVEEKDPLEVAVRKTEEGDLDKLYEKHIDDTAQKLYIEGVVNNPLNNENQYTKILDGLGLKVNLADPKNPQPSIEKIKKALSI